MSTDFTTISVEDLSFSHENKPLITNISFQANRGEHIVLSGGSGSGKSTIIKLLMGFHKANSGHIYINGEKDNFSFIRNHSAWLPQDLNIGRGLVREVIRKPFTFKANESTDISDSIIADTMERLNLDPKILNKPFRNLSTGQRQRVGLALCHLLNKPLLLLDEPTSALDKNSKKCAKDLLLGQSNKIIISASHDPWWVQQADNIVEIA